jgi:hypothetical protein
MDSIGSCGRRETLRAQHKPGLGNVVVKTDAQRSVSTQLYAPLPLANAPGVKLCRSRRGNISYMQFTGLSQTARRVCRRRFEAFRGKQIRRRKRSFSQGRQKRRPTTK